jgi:hypothetical protein
MVMPPLSICAPKLAPVRAFVTLGKSFHRVLLSHLTAVNDKLTAVFTAVRFLLFEIAAFALILLSS